MNGWGTEGFSRQSLKEKGWIIFFGFASVGSLRINSCALTKSATQKACQGNCGLHTNAPHIRKMRLNGREVFLHVDSLHLAWSLEYPVPNVLVNWNKPRAEK